VCQCILKLKKLVKSLCCTIPTIGVPRHWVGHCNGCVKFEFNNKLLYIRRNTIWAETVCQRSAYNIICYDNNILILLLEYLPNYYFTISNTVGYISSYISCYPLVIYTDRRTVLRGLWYKYIKLRYGLVPVFGSLVLSVLTELKEPIVIGSCTKFYLFRFLNDISIKYVTNFLLLLVITYFY